MVYRQGNGDLEDRPVSALLLHRRCPARIATRFECGEQCKVPLVYAVRDEAWQFLQPFWTGGVIRADPIREGRRNDALDVSKPAAVHLSAFRGSVDHAAERALYKPRCERRQPIAGQR